MGTVEDVLKCPICQDLFTDPVTLPCGHNFCLTCIRVVWNADVSEEGPFFCPECQIFLPSNLTLEVNTSLQTKVKNLITNNSATTLLQTTAPTRPATPTSPSPSHRNTTAPTRPATSTSPSPSNRNTTAPTRPATPTSPSPSNRNTTAPTRTTTSSSIRCDHCINAASVAIRTCLTCDASLCQAHALLHQQREALRDHTVVEVTGDPLSLKCREHRDELKLFCVEEEVPVCCMCVLVGPHKNHRAVQLQEACSDFKNMLETSMSQLLKRRSEAEHAIKDLETLYTQTMESAADYRERISDKYCRIRAVLEGDERLMLQMVDTEEAYMTEWLEAQRGVMEAHIKEIDELRASSRALLQETNDLRFLQQITAQGLAKPVDLPAIREVDKELCAPERMKTVERLVDDLSLALCQHFPRIWSYLSPLTLDSKTAHPKLEISQDSRQVFWSRQPLSEAPVSHRYDAQYSVLAREHFTTGQQYWEVIVQDKPYWLIGVTSGPIPRKDAPSPSNLGVNKTWWCIYHGDGQYLACHDTQEKVLSVGVKRVRKLGVLADLQKEELSFYDADTLTLLHSFSVQCLEPLYPMFNPCIDVNGLNRQPLTLFCLRDSSDWAVKASGDNE